MSPTTSSLRSRVLIVTLVSALIGLIAAAFQGPQGASAAPACSAMTQKVHLFIDAKRGVNLLTYNSSRFSKLKKGGYVDQGVVFQAARKTKGLSAVHVMYRKSNHDRIYTTSKSEIKALKKRGYKSNGVGFYAASSSRSCLSPVYRLTKGKVHRYVATAAGEKTLVAQGWSSSKIAFWANRPAASKPAVSTPAGGVFTIAVMPDTQQEVLSDGDKRFAGRTNWLVDNLASLDLKFVTHVGDVVNWDTPDHDQYNRAAAALHVLDDAGIPYSLSPGNHDTGAVCQGGGACPNTNIPQAVRNTTTFNTYLNQGVADLAGRFEPGKVDNTYSRFDAGGRHWLVLNLELWPRSNVVSWAKTVVADHPHDNVIVVTHSYLTASGGIYQTNGGYGANSPQYLYDNLISKYPNIRLVLSGHVGKAAHRIDHGVKGNRIDSFLLAMHDNTTNPMRIVQIDTTKGLLKTWVYAPKTQQDYPAYNYSASGIDWVK